MKILINENHIDWDSILTNFNPKIDFKKIDSNSHPEIENLRRDYFDAYIFDISDNYKENVKILHQLKEFNPNIKTIVLTSEMNRKYRSMLLYKEVDMFLFRETDHDLLQTIIRRIHLRLTKTR